mgnify:CR=1 FL=1
MPLKQIQTGLSSIGALFVVFIAGVVFTIGVKLFTPYTNYTTVKSVLEDVIADPSELAKTRTEIRRNIERRFTINQVNLPDRDALTIIQDENGTSFLLDYEERVSMFGNVDAVVVFKDQFKATTP